MFRKAAIACVIFALFILISAPFSAQAGGPNQCLTSWNLLQWIGFYDDEILDDLQVYTKAEVDTGLAEVEALLQQGSLRYYYSTATDSVTGGRLLSTTPNAATSSVVCAALSATTYVQVAANPRLTQTGEPGVATIPTGLISTVRYMSCDQDVSTNRRVMGINELWMVDADGSSNPTLIASSTEYTIWGTAVQRVEADYSIATDTATGGTTRRFLEKHFRKRSGTLTGADPIVTVYYGGIYEGIFSLSLPSAVVMRTDGTNADSPVFPGPVTVTGQFTAADGAEFLGTASAVKILGNPNFTDRNSIDGKCALDIWGNQLMLGSEDLSSARGNNTSKFAYIAIPHYSITGVRAPIMIFGYSIPGSTRMALGGGSNRYNAITELLIYTGATTGTREGTERARFNSTGQFLIATTTAAIDSAVKLKLNGGMEIASGGFAVIGSDTRQAGYDLTVASGAYLANVVATGTLTIPLVAPADPQPGMIWFEP